MSYHDRYREVIEAVRTRLELANAQQVEASERAARAEAKLDEAAQRNAAAVADLREGRRSDARVHVDEAARVTREAEAELQAAHTASEEAETQLGVLFKTMELAERLDEQADKDEIVLRRVVQLAARDGMAAFPAVLDELVARDPWWRPDATA